MNKKSLILFGGLLVSTAYFPAQARYHIWFEDPFLEAFDSMMRFPEQVRGRFPGLAKEDREALKVAQENLAKITHEVKDADTAFALSFKGFEGLDKKDVKVVKKKKGWLGTITTKDGIVEFFISPRGVQVTRRIELKKEDKKDKDSKEQRMYYSSSSATQAEFFSSVVDLSTLKAEPVKPTEFTLIVQKQKEELLPIS